MEKQGVVKQGVTPPEKTDEKQAAQQTTKQLDDNTTKRLADKAASSLKK